VEELLAGSGGADESLLRFGRCTVCDETLVCDAAGAPLRVLVTDGGP
jgi:hypothetical protein